jgi:hypothetical protein
MTGVIIKKKVTDLAALDAFNGTEVAEWVRGGSKKASAAQLRDWLANQLGGGTLTAGRTWAPVIIDNSVVLPLVDTLVLYPPTATLTIDETGYIVTGQSVATVENELDVAAVVGVAHSAPITLEASGQQGQYFKPLVPAGASMFGYYTGIFDTAPDFVNNIIPNFLCAAYALTENSGQLEAIGCITSSDLTEFVPPLAFDFVNGVTELCLAFDPAAGDHGTLYFYTSATAGVPVASHALTAALPEMHYFSAAIYANREGAEQFTATVTVLQEPTVLHEAVQQLVEAGAGPELDMTQVPASAADKAYRVTGMAAPLAITINGNQRTLQNDAVAIFATNTTLLDIIGGADLLGTMAFEEAGSLPAQFRDNAAADALVAAAISAAVAAAVDNSVPAISYADLVSTAPAAANAGKERRCLINSRICNFVSNGVRWLPVGGMQMMAMITMPIGIACTFTGSVDGNIVFGTPLNGLIPECYVYYAANSLAASHPAGFYWTKFSSTTDAVVYNNTFTPAAGSEPARPGTEVPFSGAVPGGTGISNTEFSLYTFGNPGGLLGDYGGIESAFQSGTNNVGGGSKSLRIKLSSISPAVSSNVGSLSNTATPLTNGLHRFKNIGNQSTQRGSPPVTGSTATNYGATIDTSVDTTVSVTLQTSNPAEWGFLFHYAASVFV